VNRVPTFTTNAGASSNGVERVGLGDLGVPDGYGLRAAIGASGAIRLVGNGSKPTPLPAQLGCCRLAPLRPQALQRAERRSMSLEASSPLRIISGVNAIGAWWR
jgi:hypothetical protein